MLNTALMFPGNWSTAGLHSVLGKGRDFIWEQKSACMLDCLNKHIGSAVNHITERVYWRQFTKTGGILFICRNICSKCILLHYLLNAFYKNGIENSLTERQAYKQSRKVFYNFPRVVLPWHLHLNHFPTIFETKAVSHTKFSHGFAIDYKHRGFRTKIMNSLIFMADTLTMRNCSVKSCSLMKPWTRSAMSWILLMEMFVKGDEY